MQTPNRICFDFDLFCYDVGWAAQSKDGDLMSWDWVMDVIDTRIKEVCDKLSLRDYYGYLTGKGNFREQIATSDVYKGNRKQEKPRYYQAIRDYLCLHHRASVVNLAEADDWIAIDMTADQGIVCVSRDKDLRQVQGWHYGYPVGKQPEYPLTYVNLIGELTYSPKGLRGTGLKFFFSQVLTGDSTDNYKGCKGKGGKFAYTLLNGLDNPDDMYDAVLKVFQNTYDETRGTVKFKEQCLLAWMIRQVTDDNKPMIPIIERGFYYEHLDYKP